MAVKSGDLPKQALLASYAAREGAYTDCFYVDMDECASFSDYIVAFFSTPIFRVERAILKLFARQKPSDRDLLHLASGDGDQFAMWRVEARTDCQILMRVGESPIRTWLMLDEQTAREEEGRLRLYFGSSVLPKGHDGEGRPKVGAIYDVFSGFHKLYSKVLLWSAMHKLKSNMKTR